MIHLVDGELSTLARQAVFAAVIAVMFSMGPQFAEAGPCSSDIAELETTVQQPGIKALDEPEQQSASVHLSLQSTPTSARWADEHLQSQFSATVARARRLDTHGDRVGCAGALSAARRMRALVAKQ